MCVRSWTQMMTAHSMVMRRSVIGSGRPTVHRKWIAGSGKELWGIDPDDLKGKLPPYLPDVPVVRQDFADYLGEAQAFDAGLGRCD